MDVLEAREAALRRQLLGSSPTAPTTAPTTAAQASLADRIKDVNARLEELNNSISGFAKLVDLYEENRKHLAMSSSDIFSSAAPRSGEEFKRAVILTSDDRVDSLAKDFQQLQDLQRYVTQLQQLHTNLPSYDQKLNHLEDTNMVQTQRAMAIHTRVERLLSTYQQMIQVLSHKCVEYNAVLDQLSFGAWCTGM